MQNEVNSHYTVYVLQVRMGSFSLYEDICAHFVAPVKMRGQAYRAEKEGEACVKSNKKRRGVLVLKAVENAST